MPWSASRRSAIALLLLPAMLGATLWPGASNAAPDARAAIVEVMNASAAAWSAGDLARFMDTYEDSEDTVFVSATGTIRGKAAIEARYAASFGRDKLGELGFDVIEIRPLGERHALMIGRYHLRSPDPAKPEASGLFTLIFHEQAGRWRIVCDHTS